MSITKLKASLSFTNPCSKSGLRHAQATRLNKSIPRLPSTDSLCLTRVSMKGCEQGWDPAGALLRPWPQLGLISLEEEGFSLLGWHRTQKFHLINAKRRRKRKDLIWDRCVSKIFLRPMCFLSCFLSQENLYHFILNVFYS